MRREYNSLLFLNYAEGKVEVNQQPQGVGVGVEGLQYRWYMSHSELYTMPQYQAPLKKPHFILEIVSLTWVSLVKISMQLFLKFLQVILTNYSRFVHIQPKALEPEKIATLILKKPADLKGKSKALSIIFTVCISIRKTTVIRQSSSLTNHSSMELTLCMSYPNCI